MSNPVPGTVWQRVQSFSPGQPDMWIQKGVIVSGPKGDKGDKGEPGRPGRDGWQGAPGAAGAAGSSLLRGYIDGLILSNDGGTPNTIIDISAGICADSTNATMLTLTTAFTKTTAAWASGTGNGGLFSGSVANATWYHVFLIQKVSDNSIDAGLDTSVSAANIPAGYSKFRRIGSILTDNSAHIVPFHQYDGEFFWNSSIKDGGVWFDVNATLTDTTAHSATVTVPTGLKVCAILNSTAFSSASNTQIYVSSLDTDDISSSVSYANDIQSGNSARSSVLLEDFAYTRTWTNTSAQVRYSVNLNPSNDVVVKMRAIGWVDLRGQNS